MKKINKIRINTTLDGKLKVDFYYKNGRKSHSEYYDKDELEYVKSITLDS